MSTQQTFALCIDCWEMHYGIPDKNGVYSRDSGSSNHFDHAVHVFGRPDDYPPPIRAVLASLNAGLPISNGRMEIFSLALAVTAIQPNNGVRVTFGDISPPSDGLPSDQISSPGDYDTDLFGEAPA